MPDNEKPTWTTNEDELRTDPDLRDDPDEEHGPESVLPAAGDTAIGQTKRTEEEKAAYEAAPHTGHSDQGHALGGSEGTAEGQ
ncbi:hypothetical protein AB4Z55_02320 [Gordonia sp. ABKF26]|uniref:hypothetical protein n=1 Tax=Gordonia sp. ABKF26 TaxID=3238687 RepID=UPI0034E5B89A